MKAKDALRGMRREHLREMASSERAHARSMELAERLMQAGLVDGVDPDGPQPIDEVALFCGLCGSKLQADEIACRYCRGGG